MNLQISMPLIGHVYSEAYQSHIHHAFGVPAYWGYKYGKKAHVVTSFISRQPIVNARMLLTKSAFENKADYVLWIDDDMVIPENGLYLLHRHDKDMVTGLCAIKEDVKKHMVLWKDPTQEDAFIPKQPPGLDTSKLFRIDATGFAFVLMKTEGLRAVHEKTKGLMFQYKYKPEDIYFYEVAKELGFELWCDPECKVGHVGLKTWNP